MKFCDLSMHHPPPHICHSWWWWVFAVYVWYARVCRILIKVCVFEVYLFHIGTFLCLYDDPAWHAPKISLGSWRCKHVMYCSLSHLKELEKQLNICYLLCDTFISKYFCYTNLILLQPKLSLTPVFLLFVLNLNWALAKFIIKISIKIKKIV